ncbi:INSulin related [Caenorhabditis elegans]|uniref:INSulin related n=1 Tax=Caenorhabditis elegans TaxID=6239 RepID=Q9U333_CAEEL|nr:INSulin related [Caenorhabditis elegans]CAB63330.1 INSulin related [Caenorhabditis elegans]|eukprot:NP_493389.1 INSulin related [Caenorhabditis elegans]
MANTCLILLLLLVIFVTVGFSMPRIFRASENGVNSSDEVSEELSYSPEEAMDLVKQVIKVREQRRHRRHRHHGQKHCGTKIVRKLQMLCPKMCTISDDTLLTEMCSHSLFDDEIQLRCCPKEDE